jgi:hypothetical protein
MRPFVPSVEKAANKKPDDRQRQPEKDTRQCQTDNRCEHDVPGFAVLAI